MHTPKQNLLTNFYFLVIAINLLAICFDVYLKHYNNSIIEAIVVVFLGLGLFYLHKTQNIKIGAYIFLITTSLALFTLIHVNHFATLSIVFVLLLPLTTLLFLELKETFFVMIVYVLTFAGLLYLEYLTNPQNPLISNANALFTLGYALIIIYLFGIFYHFFIMKTFGELDKANEQKTMLLGEVHHRVKNNLNVIASILGLQALNLSEKEKAPLTQTKTRIEAMGMVHEMLYKNEDAQHVDVKVYVENLSKLLLNLYDKKNVHVKVDTNNINLPLQLMFQLGIITNELLTNSFKYAFPENSGSIHVELKSEDNKYIFTYKDSGNGVENMEQLSKSKSLGYKLITLGAKQLQGDLHVNPKPLTYTLEFPHE